MVDKNGRQIVGKQLKMVGKMIDKMFGKVADKMVDTMADKMADKMTYKNVRQNDLQMLDKNGRQIVGKQIENGRQND